MMKSYKKMADEVLEAVSEYNTKRINRNIRLRIAAPAACCCLAAVLALGMWKSGIFNSSETAKPDTDFNWTGKPSAEPNIGEETETDSDPASDTAEGQPQVTSDTDGQGEETDSNLIFPPYESGAVSGQDTSTEVVQHPPIETAEPFTERVPVANEPNSYFDFVENAHAPLDGYEFTLPLTPKDTDIILALLNAYDIPDGSSDAVNTQYALDIGIYLEAGYSNVRTCIPAEKGDNVYALQDGTVIYADYNGSLGNNIWVKNSEGTYILYYHLNEMAVNYGDTVSKDQIIGYAGSTGMTTENAVGYSRRNTVTDSMWADWHRENNEICISHLEYVSPDMKINHGWLSEWNAIYTEDFIIYMNRIYFKYGEADAAALDSYMGTASGTIDENELSSGSGCSDFSGTAAAGDVYGVKNYNTSDFLGIKRENKADIYFHNNGIALRCGSDLICHMLKMYDYTNKEYCYNGATCLHCTSDSPTLNTDELIKFLDTMSEAEFVYFDDIYAGSLIEKIWFTMENGIKYEFELYEGGFVRFDGLKLICLNVGVECFEAGHYNEHDENVEHTEYSEHHNDHHSEHH